MSSSITLVLVGIVLAVLVGMAGEISIYLKRTNAHRHGKHQHHA